MDWKYIYYKINLFVQNKINGKNIILIISCIKWLRDGSVKKKK